MATKKKTVKKKASAKGRPTSGKAAVRPAAKAPAKADTGAKAKNRPVAKKGGKVKAAGKAVKRPTKPARKTGAVASAKPAKPAAPAGKKVIVKTAKPAGPKGGTKAAPKSSAQRSAPIQVPSKKGTIAKNKPTPREQPNSRTNPTASTSAVKAKDASPAKTSAKPTAAPVIPAPAPAPSPTPKPASKPRDTKPKGPVVAVMTGVDPLGAPVRQLRRAMKERFTMEYYLRATPGSLYDLISTPSGFSEWFCDDVDVRGDEFTFHWGSDTQTAQCLSRRSGELIRFQWVNEEDGGAFFELRIRIDPMTNETCLVVTDHAWPKDVEEAKALWNSQLHTLQRVLGA